jgi:hypothetical protein
MYLRNLSTNLQCAVPEDSNIDRMILRELDGRRRIRPVQRLTCVKCLCDVMYDVAIRLIRSAPVWGLYLLRFARLFHSNEAQSKGTGPTFELCGNISLLVFLPSSCDMWNCLSRRYISCVGKDSTNKNPTTGTMNNTEVAMEVGRRPNV